MLIADGRQNRRRKGYKNNPTPNKAYYPFAYRPSAAKRIVRNRRRLKKIPNPKYTPRP